MSKKPDGERRVARTLLTEPEEQQTQYGDTEGHPELRAVEAVCGHADAIENADHANSEQHHAKNVCPAITGEAVNLRQNQGDENEAHHRHDGQHEVGQAPVGADDHTAGHERDHGHHAVQHIERGHSRAEGLDRRDVTQHAVGGAKDNSQRHARDDAANQVNSLIGTQRGDNLAGRSHQQCHHEQPPATQTVGQHAARNGCGSKCQRRDTGGQRLNAGGKVQLGRSPDQRHGGQQGVGNLDGGDNAQQDNRRVVETLSGRPRGCHAFRG